MKSSKILSPVLSCQALKELLRSSPKRISILETDIGKQSEAAYKSARIPQARYFDQLECTQPTKLIPRGLPEIKCFESYLTRLGVSNNDHIVLYDRSPVGFYATGRAWWLLKTYGVNHLSILNGGFQKWLQEANVTESTDNDQPKTENDAKFTVHFNEQMLKKYDDLLHLVSTKSKQTQIVDARPPSSYNAANSGLILGSLNVPYPNLFDKTNNVLKSSDELRKLFTDAGVDLSKPSIYTCQTGTTAATLAFVAFLLGQKSFSVYNGSFTEWQQLAPKEYIVQGQTTNPAA